MPTKFSFLKILPSLVLNTIPFVGFFVLGWDIRMLIIVFTLETIFFLGRVHLLFAQVKVNRYSSMRTHYIALTILGFLVAVVCWKVFSQPGNVYFQGVNFDAVFVLNLALIAVDSFLPSSKLHLRRGLFFPQDYIFADLGARITWIIWLLYLVPFTTTHYGTPNSPEFFGNMLLFWLLFVGIRSVLDYNLMVERTKAGY